MSRPPWRLPVALDVLDRVATNLGGRHAVSLEPGSLLQAAARIERWDDFGDDGFREPLHNLVQSLQHDADLHVLGRFHLRSVIVRALRTRLRLTRYLFESSGREEGPRHSPIIVCGLPRTGTTMLHRLLAALPGLRGLPLWELVEPLPPKGEDRRLAQARKRTRRMQWLSGNRLDAQHLMRPELPDECGHLFRPAFLSPAYAVAPAHSYLTSYYNHDARPAYREYRTYLGILSNEDPRRLVLKDPFHALFLDALFEAMPYAMVVQTHRRPQEVLPSFVKLCTTAQSLVTRRLDMIRTAQTLHTWLSEVARRSVERAAQGRHDVFDIDYRALVADPVEAVAALHHHFALPFDEAWRKPLQQMVDKSRERPPNPYTLNDYGLDETGIQATFSGYTGQFL
ncbi:MAG: sulfotransferase [Myxococcota bacterium]